MQRAWLPWFVGTTFATPHSTGQGVRVTPGRDGSSGPYVTDELSRAERRARTQELFAKCDESADDVERDWLREQITTLNMGIAESAAHRYRGRGENEEDLEQVAYLGLVKAVNGYESSYDKDFLSYAMPTIAGELKKHFRDYCWAVRPPRRIQDLQRTIVAVSEDLRREYDQRPTTAQLADAIDVDRDEIEEALAADGCFTPSSLDVGAGRAEVATVGELIVDEEHGFDRVEALMVLSPVVRALSERDRDIIELRFFHEWTQEGIAQELGVTQMQVSRLLARIMNALYKRITFAAERSVTRSSRTA